MLWYHWVSYFFGGAFLTNAMPHMACGLMGQPFQSPFAKPPGKGLSSSTVNVLWGWFNVAVAYALICQVGTFELRNLGHAATFSVGAVLMSVMAAQTFGKLHGGSAGNLSQT